MSTKADILLTLNRVNYATIQRVFLKAIILLIVAEKPGRNGAYFHWFVQSRKMHVAPLKALMREPQAFNNHNHNKNHMGYKTCAICGRKVDPGEGMYYGGRLIHRTCHGIAKIQRYKLNEEPAKGKSKR